MKFFGWRMVFTGLAVEFTVIGFLFYSFPIFWPYLISELGMTESQLGMVTAFYFIPVAILAIFVGWALDKYSVKNFMMLGSMIYAIGLFSLSFIISKSIIIMSPTISTKFRITVYCYFCTLISYIN